MVAHAQSHEKEKNLTYFEQPDDVRQMRAFRGSFSGFERNPFFINPGGKQPFAEAGFALGVDYDHDGRAVAPIDIDNDGDLDLLVSNVADRTDLLRNEGGNRRNWVSVELIGKAGRTQSAAAPGSNRQGVGARVILTAGDLRQMDDVHLAVSYQSARGNRLHFGLGQRNQVDVLEVRWPSGVVDRIENVTPNRVVVIREGEGLVER